MSRFSAYRTVMRGAVAPDYLVPDQVRLGLIEDLSYRDFALIEASSSYSMVDVGGDWLAGIGDVVKDWDIVPTRPPFDNCWLEAVDTEERANISIAVCREDDHPSNRWRMLVFYQPWGLPLVSMAPGSYVFDWSDEGLLQPNMQMGTWDSSAEAKESLTAQKVFTNTAIVTFALLHCKNVELVERLPKRHEQREAKRKGEPILKYHEIVIDPGKTKQVAIGAGSASQDHPSRALHIARGHFATYTEDKPLFGKYTGTFWRPAHVRGSAELGAVKSTYKVKGAA